MSKAKPILTMRRAQPFEQTLVRGIVQTVVDETYGGQWAPAPLPIDDEDWSLAWLGLVGETIAGIALTQRDWVGDLWVLKDCRGLGVGSMLLARSETEIAERGYPEAKLCVVSTNTKALPFYAARGWVVMAERPHQRDPITMVVMSKALGPPAD